MSAEGVRALVPILRSFDEGETRGFYLRHPGFEVAFEHRFGPGMPLYMGMTSGSPSGGHELHLSKHHDDANPGFRDRGRREVTLTDPGGNRLIFRSPLKDA